MRHPGLIILAAGGSRRMGQPKQLLRWGGQTLLRHACETALRTACRPVVLVLGCAADDCRRECTGLPLTIVENPDWAQGLGSSIAAGIAALTATDPAVPGALLMLADQPHVSSPLLELLIAHWSPPTWPIAAVAYEEAGGVPALFDRAFFSALLALRHDAGARSLLVRERHRVALIDAGERLVDIDTPEIYRAHLPEGTVRDVILLGDFTD